MDWVHLSPPDWFCQTESGLSLQESAGLCWTINSCLAHVKPEIESSGVCQNRWGSVKSSLKRLIIFWGGWMDCNSMMWESNWHKRGVREDFFCSTERTVRLMFSRADRRQETSFSAVSRLVLEGSCNNCSRHADARLLTASKIQCAFLVAWFRSRLDCFWNGASKLSERGPVEGWFKASRRWTPLMIALTEEVGSQIWTSGVEDNSWYWWRDVQNLLGCVFAAGPSSERVEAKMAEATSVRTDARARSLASCSNLILTRWALRWLTGNSFPRGRPSGPKLHEELHDGQWHRKVWDEWAGMSDWKWLER